MTGHLLYLSKYQTGHPDQTVKVGQLLNEQSVKE